MEKRYGHAQPVGVESDVMARVIELHIERLPEGYYLATSVDVQGSVAQGRAVNETVEIAGDVPGILLSEPK